jgi:hypothetical protein
MPSDQTTLERFFIILFRWGLCDYSIEYMLGQSTLLSVSKAIPMTPVLGIGIGIAIGIFTAVKPIAIPRAFAAFVLAKTNLPSPILIDCLHCDMMGQNGATI